MHLSQALAGMRDFDLLTREHWQLLGIQDLAMGGSIFMELEPVAPQRGKLTELAQQKQCLTGEQDLSPCRVSNLEYIWGTWIHTYLVDIQHACLSYNGMG